MVVSTLGGVSVPRCLLRSFSRTQSSRAQATHEPRANPGSRHQGHHVRISRLRALPSSLHLTRRGTSTVEATHVQQQSSSVRLGLYIAAWYALSVSFTIVNKLTLTAFPMPLLLSCIQLMASSAIMCILWGFRIHPIPKLPPGFLRSLLPVAFFHSVGHVAACISFCKMSVSFTHVVKASEPVFTVGLSGPILGVTYSMSVWASLVPIVAGCFLAALHEASFSCDGCFYAMWSNLGMVLRGIYSGKCLQGFEGMDGVNLFGLISIASLIFCIPAAIIIESSHWPQAASAAATALGSTSALLQLLLVGGIFYHFYNQVSYTVLNQGISPASFSVGNTMKRVVIIVASVAFFRNPVSPLNWLGSAVAVFGTYVYSAARAKEYSQRYQAAS